MMAMVAHKVMLLIFWFNFLFRKPTRKPSMAFMVKVPGANCTATRISAIVAPAPAMAPTRGPKVMLLRR